LLRWTAKATAIEAVRIADNLLTNWWLNFGDASLLASTLSVHRRSDGVARGHAPFFSDRLHPLAHRHATKDGCHIGG
jgi:hypothetical protein